MLSCIYHSSQPATHAAASAKPRSHTSQQHPSRFPSHKHSLDLTKVGMPSFGPEVFAGLDQIGLDWQPNWPNGLTPPAGLLADAAAVEYFRSPSFATTEYRSQKGATSCRSEQRHSGRYPGSPEATGSSSVGDHLMGDSSGLRDDRWYGTLAQIKRLRLLIHSMTRSPQMPALLREDREDGHGSLRIPPLLDTVIELESQARLQKEQNDKESLARLLPRVSSASKIRQLLPPRQACKKLVSAYFETFGSVLCILDTTVFLNDVERFWEKKVASQSSMADHEESFAHKLLVVVALGSVTCPGSPGSGSTEAHRARHTSRRNHAIVCVQHTRQWLAQKTERGIRVDLDIAQILCLLALARLTQLHTDPWPRRPSTDGTIILTGDHDLARLGIQMGLHREPRVPGAVKEAEREMRRRLWATMLELSLHQYLDGELPPPLNAESYDCAEPSPSRLDEDHRSYLELDYQRVPASTVLAVLSRTQRLRLRILQHLYAPGATMTSNESQRLAAELNKACNVEMNNLLSLGMARPTSFQLWMVNILTRPFVLALNAPFGGELECKFTSYYFRRMRMETAILMLRSSPHDDGLSLMEPQAHLRSSQAGPRSQTTQRAPYPFLPTPSTGETCSSNSRQQSDIHKVACTALCVGGPGYFSVVQRQVVATLCADVIAEVQDDLFPALDAAMFQNVVAILEDVVNEFRTQVHASGGIHACRELILFTAAHSFAAALLLHRCGSAREVDESIRSSLWMALHHCCKAMGEPAEGVLEMDWEIGIIDAVDEPPRHVTAAGDAAADEDAEIEAQMQRADFVLEPRDEVQELAASTADAEIADMWALDDDESYFSVGIRL